jgi:hypothetical protein
MFYEMLDDVKRFEEDIKGKYLKWQKILAKDANFINVLCK